MADTLPKLPEPWLSEHLMYGSHVYTADQMRAYGAEVRRQALEEAARMCSQRYDTQTAQMQKQRGIHARDMHSSAAIEAHQCAAAIRSLIDKDATSGEPGRSCPAPTAPRPTS